MTIKTTFYDKYLKQDFNEMLYKRDFIAIILFLILELEFLLSTFTCFYFISYLFFN